MQTAPRFNPSSNVRVIRIANQNAQYLSHPQMQQQQQQQQQPRLVKVVNSAARVGPSNQPAHASLVRRVTPVQSRPVRPSPIVPQPRGVTMATHRPRLNVPPHKLYNTQGRPTAAVLRHSRMTTLPNRFQNSTKTYARQTPARVSTPMLRASSAPAATTSNMSVLKPRLSTPNVIIPSQRNVIASAIAPNKAADDRWNSIVGRPTVMTSSPTTSAPNAVKASQVVSLKTLQNLGGGQMNVTSLANRTTTSTSVMNTPAPVSIIRTSVVQSATSMQQRQVVAPSPRIVRAPSIVRVQTTRTTPVSRPSTPAVVLKTSESTATATPTTSQQTLSEASSQNPVVSQTADRTSPTMTTPASETPTTSSGAIKPEVTNVEETVKTQDAEASNPVCLTIAFFLDFCCQNYCFWFFNFPYFAVSLVTWTILEEGISSQLLLSFKTPIKR